MSIHFCPSMECAMSGHKPSFVAVPEADFGSDTLADLERARSWAVALEQQNAALIEALRSLLPLSLHRSRRTTQCAKCRAQRLLAACDGIPE